MALDNIKDLLYLHEGKRNKLYRDTVGKETIGVGFNLTDVGLYDDEIEAIFWLRLKRHVAALERDQPWAADLDPVRIAVLVDMHYNLGAEPFDHDGVKDWPMFISQVKNKQWNAAALNMLSTKWARQVGRRATRLAEMMRTGEWPKK